MKDELLKWSAHLRDNFDKLLLFSLVVALITLVVHMAHDKIDSDHISWAREITGTVLGGLMGLVTGAKLGSIIRKGPEPPDSTDRP